MADPFAIAEQLIAADECQRAVLGLAWALRAERKLSKSEHGELLLSGLCAGRRGCEATRTWVEQQRPKQARLL